MVNMVNEALLCIWVQERKGWDITIPRRRSLFGVMPLLLVTFVFPFDVVFNTIPKVVA